MEGRQKKFLHGTLEISIFDSTPYKPPYALNLCLCRNEKPKTYVTIKIDNDKVAKTSHEKQLIWNQSFQIPCAHPSTSIITITMKTNFSILGNIEIPARKILDDNETLINGFFPITNVENGKPHPSLKLRFMLWFKPADLEPSWGTLLVNGEYKGVKNASFPNRANCDVRLYQDAHHCLGFQPPFNHLDLRSPRRLFEDVYKAIEDAKHLIYIVGWSFNPKMVLVRDNQTDIPHAIGVKLGELLKRKAEEGVAVRIMVWDDETSLPFIKNKGVMGTHDEDAVAYFKKTKVVCKLCPRLHDEFPMLFTHHQKTITVDSRVSFSSSNREIVSFIGGLDLFDGRYDTEEHSLFRTLNTDQSHCCDFYQTSISGANLLKGGPREPWHDTHACIIGEAACDILRNFEQRWRKEFNPSLLLPETIISELHHHSSIQRDWNVQVFRSIDHFSAMQMPKYLSIETSVHEAYVEAIRRAENFIYIENQYFIGGCHLWSNDQHSGCRNLIPIEIALKVARKIRAKERFAVYIVVPMWPEGTPESESVQEILHWTRETMAMIYKIIGDAIKETGEPGHPKDYLNFFCLANREEKRKGEFIPPHSPHSKSSYWKAQKNRRFMVYVHSKLMIVDDTYMLIGSANINQRSMDGQRDTEIAIGCYQVDEELKESGSLKKRGDIHEFRMSLWYEHTRFTKESLLKEPESMECVESVRGLGEKMWDLYRGDKIMDMDGVHLVGYPISVQKDGSIDEEDSCFPDTKALIMGKRSKVLPTMATT
ncbi:phospholipase D alpha 4 [Impatiens glandulifera]|uniref:phospholipase D alpha 4 n=1 Tax=Impatiens glandulifera TaxID=253017 RepID=UPI001FB07ACE|nr:phospholipase D alpha 4 [Impatiens glandulifera]